MSCLIPAHPDTEAGPDHSLDGVCLRLTDLCTRLLGRYYARIPVEDRRDLVQEVVFDFWLRRTRIANVEAWACLTARHKAANWLARHERTRRADVPLPEVPAPPAAPDDDEARIQTLFLALARPCRWLLGRIYIGGLSIRALARYSGRDPRQISRQRHNCLEALRTRWQAQSRTPERP